MRNSRNTRASGKNRIRPGNMKVTAVTMVIGAQTYPWKNLRHPSLEKCKGTVWYAQLPGLWVRIHQQKVRREPLHVCVFERRRETNQIKDRWVLKKCHICRSLSVDLHMCLVLNDLDVYQGERFDKWVGLKHLNRRIPSVPVLLCRYYLAFSPSPISFATIYTFGSIWYKHKNFSKSVETVELRFIFSKDSIKEKSSQKLLMYFCDNRDWSFEFLHTDWAACNSLSMIEIWLNVPGLFPEAFAWQYLSCTEQT